MIGFLDLFSGGALGKVSIFALGIGPYITASIIMQLLAVIIPYLENLQKEEGEAGRRKIQQLTRQFTVILAFFQSFVFVTILSKLPGSIMHSVNPFMFFMGSMIALTAGAVMVMWLAELITEKYRESKLIADKIKYSKIKNEELTRIQYKYYKLVIDEYEKVRKIINEDYLLCRLSKEDSQEYVEKLDNMYNGALEEIENIKEKE